MWWFSSKNIQKNCWGLVFMNFQRAPPSLSLISYKTSNSYAICAVWCVMCVVPGFFFCKILILWVKGRPKIPHLGSFRPFEGYSKIDHRWQSYVHFILQGLLKQWGASTKEAALIHATKKFLFFQDIFKSVWLGGVASPWKFYRSAYVQTRLLAAVDSFAQKVQSRFFLGNGQDAWARV